MEKTQTIRVVQKFFAHAGGPIFDTAVIAFFVGLLYSILYFGG